MTDSTPTPDMAWRARARRVIPGGMYGHKNVAHLPDGYPQFFSGAHGASVTDVNGVEYIDLMCSWGPVILGHGDPGVEAAVAGRLNSGDCLDGPQPVMVELAEAMTARVEHADWAMFAKNGTDVMTVATRVARRATGSAGIVMATGSYHGIGAWSLPEGSPGLTAQDSALTRRCEYNDIESLRAAVEATPDLAAIVLTPVRHDVRRDLEPVTPEFAREARRLCDAHGAVLILDDIRCGLRLDPRGSWAPLGISPDISTWSKAIGNGHPIAALLGRDALADAASVVTATGSFWLAAGPMAAALETWTRFDDPATASALQAAGSALTAGFREQAARHGVAAKVTGPDTLPFLSFEGDADFRIANAWCVEALRRGLYTHPTHNWFVGVQHTPDVIARVLERTDDVFAAIARDTTTLEGVSR